MTFFISGKNLIHKTFSPNRIFLWRGIESYFTYIFAIKQISHDFGQHYEHPVIVRHLGTIKVQLALERESNVAEIKSQRRNSVPTRRGRGVALH